MVNVRLKRRKDSASLGNPKEKLVFLSNIVFNIIKPAKFPQALYYNVRYCLIATFLWFDKPN